MTTIEIITAIFRGFQGTNSFRKTGKQRERTKRLSCLSYMNGTSQWERYRCIASQLPAHPSWPCVVIPLLDPVNMSPLATWCSVTLLSSEDAGRTLQEEGASLSGPSILSYLFLWNCGQEWRASQWIWTARLYTAFYRALSAPQGTAACSPVLAERTSVNFLALHWATATLSPSLVLGRPSSSLSHSLGCCDAAPEVWLFSVSVTPAFFRIS